MASIGLRTGVGLRLAVCGLRFKKFDISRMGAGLTLVLAAQGCRSGGNDLMPLSEKSHWNYLVRSVDAYSNRLTVTRRIAVGDTNGFEIKGNLGTSHMGWSQGRLLSDQMAGCRFMPPIVLLAPSEKLVNWAGWIDWGESHEPAKAQIRSEPQRLEVEGAPTMTTRSIVSIKLPHRTMELTNWFKPGLGIVRQEQRTNGRVDVTLEYLDQS